ncbi:hypothetical protein HanRHA438_Chr03g0115871 [Helianthus annuus]|nr:hypothetical protein HanRHA438_Chr03g0115871 [Helianthus annuus]
MRVNQYPIYRSPMGPTLKDLNAVFYLSFSSYTNHRLWIFSQPLRLRAFG